MGTFRVWGTILKECESHWNHESMHKHDKSYSWRNFVVVVVVFSNFKFDVTAREFMQSLAHRLICYSKTKSACVIDVPLSCILAQTLSNCNRKEWKYVLIKKTKKVLMKSNRFFSRSWWTYIPGQLKDKNNHHMIGR